MNAFMIFCIKTRVGREIGIADAIQRRAQSESSGIYAVFVPIGVKGYVFIEADNKNSVSGVIKDLRYVTGMLKEPVSVKDLESVLSPPAPLENISEGDIVEIIASPFKGEHARVVGINGAKKEITVELMDVMVPIPLTIKSSNVKLLEKKV
jgi:ribosomal protein L24p/L26e, archaeal